MHHLAALVQFQHRLGSNRVLGITRVGKANQDRGIDQVGR